MNHLCQVLLSLFRQNGLARWGISHEGVFRIIVLCVLFLLGDGMTVAMIKKGKNQKI